MRPLIVAAVVALSFPAAAAGPFNKFTLDNWSGGAFTHNETGAFSHCAVSASYRSGTSMHASVTSNFTWNLGFANRNWNLKVGDSVPMEFVFDRNATVRIAGKVVQPTLLVVTMPSESQIVRDFRGAAALELYALGARYTFKLTSTSQIMPVLVDCVRQNANLKVAVGVTPGAQPTPPNDGALQQEAVTMATNFLLASQLPEPRVLSRAEAPPELAASGAAWRAAGATGMVRIVRVGPDQKAVDVATAIAAGDGKNCQGRFASGRTSELVDSDVMIRGFSSCEDSKGPRQAEYYVVPRRAGGFAVFSIVTAGTGPGSSPLPEDKRATLQRAALKAAQ